MVQVLALEGFADDHRRLQPVDRGIAEYEVVGLVLELVRDHRPGGDVVDGPGFRFLVERCAAEGDAGVDETDDRDDVFLIISSCAICTPSSFLGLVVAIDQQQRPSQHPAGTMPISSAAMWAALRMLSPASTNPPVKGPSTPIRIGSRGSRGACRTRGAE